MNVLRHSKKILSIGLLALPLTMSVSMTGCLTDDKDDDTTKASVSTPWQSDANVSVGAQGHLTLGTALDLDNKAVLLSAAANAAQGTIDLLFVYSGSEHKLMSPVAAKGAGDVELANNYTDSQIKNTQFVKVTTKPKDSEAGAAAYAAGTKVSSSKVASGDMFIVKTGSDKLVFVKVDAIAGSEKAAAANLILNLSGL